MRVIGHRGNSSVAPQNTLAAFESACAAGVDAIELDVQLTADGHPVVIHDDAVDATTDGTGRVDSLALAQVRALDAGAWFAPAYAGQRVPVLAEVVDLLVRHPAVELLLELKGVWTADRVRLLVGPLAEAGLLDRVVGQSFEPASVAALREVAPQLRRGLLVEELPSGPDGSPDLPALDRLCASLGVMTCNPDGRLLQDHPELVTRQHAAGRQVMAWTLDEPWTWEAAGAMAVDAVITNRPDRLRGWLAAGRGTGAVGSPERADTEER